jgi:hypothetical protein
VSADDDPDDERVPRPRRTRPRREAVEPREPEQRRTPAQRSTPTRRTPTQRRGAADRDGQSADGNGQIRSATAAAKLAIQEIAALTGRVPDNIVSIERRDDGWCVAVELVETHRIPDTADILAIYETELGSHGELLSYRRTRRYLRGRVQEE